MFGQTTPKPLEFEVASIRPHPAGDTSSRLGLVPGGVNGTNVTLLQLIRTAYQIDEFQLVGAPGWVSDERWDVMARNSSLIPDDPNTIPVTQRAILQPQLEEMLRSLLADRFQLVARRESRQQSVYFLIVGNRGHKLSQTTDASNSVSTNANNGRNLATFSGSSMGRLAQQISRRVGTPVIDRTGLSGTYDFKLEWTSELGEPGAAANPADSSAPSIFTAVQEQLGLRLESGKGLADVLVVERAARPSEN